MTAFPDLVAEPLGRRCIFDLRRRRCFCGKTGGATFKRGIEQEDEEKEKDGLRDEKVAEKGDKGTKRKRAKRIC